MPLARRSILLAAPAALFALSGCGNDSPSSSASGPKDGAPSPDAPTFDELSSIVNGFSVGSTMAAARAFVFFDPNCPSCGMFWNEIKPLLKLMHFTWVPVGLIAPNSAKQGAAILEAANPVEAMEDHKVKLLKRLPGITAMNVTDETLALIETNTAVFSLLGADAVPFTLGRAGSGASVKLVGGKPASFVAAQFGLTLS